MADENIITMVDEETGEEIELQLIDGFEKDDRNFAVFLTMAENDEDAELVILEEIDEGEEVLLQSLEEGEEDEIFDYYDALCEEDLAEDEPEA